MPTDLWSGLPLTLILAIVGLAAAFPLAVLLALGRRSEMPAVRALSVAYIELIRGVPLITVLFMASVMLPLFLPEGTTIDKLLRAQVGFILFYAAYLAEVVRGGLQAIPKGQYEAADALGLGYWRKMALVILPQALKIAIPPLVNIFIAGFKDTTLVTIIGLFDLMATASQRDHRSRLARLLCRGLRLRRIAIYFVFCFFMSRYSGALERSLARGRTMSGAPMIELRDVHKWYGAYHALKDVSLAVARGERVVVCGPSGSGKSTMIRCINRLEEHQQGEIVVDGIELTGDLKQVEAIRREVGMVFQQFNLFPHLTVLRKPDARAALGPQDAAQGGGGAGDAAPRARANPRAGAKISGPAVGRAAAARRHRPRLVHAARR